MYKKKPLSFNTTLRNPNRIAGFLSVLNKYEGQILTNDLIYQICYDIISKKLYKPTAISKNREWQDIYNSPTIYFTVNEAQEILNLSPQKHKEAGFDYGWASRFDTWYKLIMEFGLCCYEKNAPIEISTLGKNLIKAYDESATDDDLIQNIFLNILAKFQTSTPFRKNANNNIPLMLLLKVIKLLKNDKKENNAGVYKREIPFFLCWQNNNAEELYKYIKNFRKQYSFEASDEIIYEHCLNLFLDEHNKDIESLKTYIKSSKLLKESVDEYIRKMRITGVISLRGNGRFLDFNMFEIEKIDYLINNYGDCINFISKREYYNYIQKKDSFLFKNFEKDQKDLQKIKQSVIKKYAEIYSEDKLINELIFTYKGTTKDDLLKFIDNPVRLEFLTAIALVKYFENITVIANYSSDDEGLPKFTARGGMADIECFQKNCYALVEVTLMTGASQQTEHEMTSISDHLKTASKNSEKYTIALFIAPILQERAIDYMEYMNERKLINKNCGGIISMRILDMIPNFKKVDEITDFVNI